MASGYTFDNAAVRQSTQRFECLQQCYDPVTVSRLSDMGVRPGWRCLEVGAGAGSIAEWLGHRVGDAGSVTATDIDTGLIDVRGSNIEVLRHDIVCDPLPEAAFDLVHSRLVLLHLPERRRALHQIWHALKPGGWLVLDEFDCTWLPVLASPAPESERLFATVVGTLHRVLADAGADPGWGAHAYQALVETGFVDLDVRGFSEAWRGGSVGAHLHRANIRQTADRLLATGVVTEQDLADFLLLVEDPGFTVSSYLMLTTSGRRPEGRGRYDGRD
ncbi:MAG: class I SAM-dependent methyltransferase [Nocardioides sp.]